MNDIFKFRENNMYNLEKYSTGQVLAGKEVQKNCRANLECNTRNKLF